MLRTPVLTTLDSFGMLPALDVTVVGAVEVTWEASPSLSSSKIRMDDALRLTIVFCTQGINDHTPGTTLDGLRTRMEE